ncbi:MAG TPA: hypothetical protein VLH79_14610 [Chthonomonadales bacterium]|nr:hypothetical protein [Chthonomonadales bacterium]
MGDRRSIPARKLCLDVAAAYNRERLSVKVTGQAPPSASDHLVVQPAVWASMSMRDTEAFLMEIYIARRRHMQ